MGNCSHKLDADCVIYEDGNKGGLSTLHTLNVPNGSSLKQILERIDQLFAFDDPGANAAAFKSTLEILGITGEVSNIADLLSVMARQIVTAKQSVTNIQTFVQKQIASVANSVSELNNPSIAAGGIDVTDTLHDALSKLAGTLESVTKAIPKVSTQEANAINIAADGGMYVASPKPYQPLISTAPGNMLQSRADGFYVAANTNGMDSEQLLEILINAGINAEPGSTLAIKFKQLLQTHQ